MEYYSVVKINYTHTEKNPTMGFTVHETNGETQTIFRVCEDMDQEELFDTPWSGSVKQKTEHQKSHC